MIPRISALLLLGMTAGFAIAQPGPTKANVPKGVYVTFALKDLIDPAQKAANSPSYPDPATDAVIVKYFTTLLDNLAVSGLAPQIAWNLLNPNDPGRDPFHPAAGAYVWNPLDDLFSAVDQWNRAHAWLAPKTIQLIPTPGYNSPGWVFDTIDASVCGGRAECAGAGSCDGLFMASPAQPTSHECGYTTFFVQSEGTPTAQLPLPLPWNSAYKRDWQTFLFALNEHIRHEPSGSAFASIAMAGPTATSAEMILPSPQDQRPYTCKSAGNDYLSLNETLVATPPGSNNIAPVCPLTNPKFEVPTAWNMLFANFYGSQPNYQNTDLPFIEEWDAAIDMYSRVFNGVTLVLTTTTDALPNFPGADPSLLIPAPGFVSDCGNDPQTNPSGDPAGAMQCAAVTQVLAHFTSPLTGGFNSKATQESGLTANKNGIDLSTNGIKWLAATTSSGRAPLAGAPFRMSRILGGLQFSGSFSRQSYLQVEGCPDYTPANPSPVSCNNLTPSGALENVLSISYFPGTAVGPFFCPFTTDSGMYGCASTTVNDSSIGGNFDYSNAPMNYVQIYDEDILYASGLGGCSVYDITGNPVEHIPPSCVASATADVAATQAELNLASDKLRSIAEPAILPWFIPFF